MFEHCHAVPTEKLSLAEEGIQSVGDQRRCCLLLGVVMKMMEMWKLMIWVWSNGGVDRHDSQVVVEDDAGLNSRE